MNRFEAWLVHVATLLVGGTGLVYAGMRYLLTAEDPYAVVNHPWQPTVQHAHVLVAPLLVFAAGLIWREHAWKHFRQNVPARRKSGLTLLAFLAPMVGSGYLLQTTTEGSWRTAWLVVHLVTSGLWLVGYGGHFVAYFFSSLRASSASAAKAPKEAQGPRSTT